MATAQNSRVTQLGLPKILPKVVDAVNKSNWIIRRTMSNPVSANGNNIQWNINTTSSTLGTSFKGVETFSTSIDFAPVQAVEYYTGYAQPVTLSRVEQGINQTPLGQIKLKLASFEFAQNSMSQALGTIMYGFGVGNDFNGLGYLVDDSTNTSTFAGLSRTTYGTYVNCGGSTGIVAATAGVLDLATMDSADDAATVSGLESESPNVVLTTRAVWSLYGSLLEPQKVASYGALGGGSNAGDAKIGQVARGNVALNGGSSFLEYRGKPVLADNKATSGVMWFLNESLLEFQSLSIPGLSTVRVANQVTEGVYDKVPPTAFQFRDLMSPVNQLAEVGVFVVYGQLIHKNPIRNEKISGITTT
jgi:hypothetical protein